MSGEPAHSESAEVSLDDVEPSVDELLRRYQQALKFAAEMPFLGRSDVSGDVTGLPWGSRFFRRRWGSRTFTTAYVETHVRKQLQALRRALWLELLGVGAREDRERIEALDARLEGAVAPLLRWRRLAQLVTRLPWVSVALPVLYAAIANPLDAPGSHEVLYAVVVLAITAVVLWIAVVLPSVSLGFRIKRAVFAGGKDLARPAEEQPGELRWEGFPRRDGEPSRDGVRMLAFPTESVYEAETEVFRALGRRKPLELPVDMIFGLGVYLQLAGSAVVILALLSETPPFQGWSILAWLVLLPVALVVPFQIVRQVRRNFGERPH